jgi:signal transduction histidine kinase
MAARSLKFRLIAAAAAWVAAGLVAAGLVIRISFEDSVQRTFQLRLLATLRSLVSVVEVQADGKLSVTKPIGDPRFDQAYGGWYWQITGESQTALRSRSLWDFDLPTTKAGDPGEIRFGKAVDPRGRELLTAERDLAFAPSDRTVHVVVAASRYDVDKEINRFDTILLVSFLCLGAGLLAALWFQASFGLAPLEKLARDLDNLRKVPGARLGGDHPAEIAPLAQALDSVLDHDSQLIERARTHVGNLAHGLKTPLAVMKAELAADRADIGVLHEQLDRVSRLVEHNLTKARSEATLARALGSETPVAPVVDDIVRTLSKAYGHRGLEMISAIDRGAAFPGDSEDLAEMVGNLAENACKWAGSKIRLSSEPSGIVVDDDGPGLGDDECQAVTERGTRLDENTPGHGLGLSIVAELAQLHGGRLELSRSELGGLKARLTWTARRLTPTA